jgi:hypothetical protein
MALRAEALDESRALRSRDREGADTAHKACANLDRISVYEPYGYSLSEDALNEGPLRLNRSAFRELRVEKRRIITAVRILSSIFPRKYRVNFMNDETAPAWIQLDSMVPVTMRELS